MSRGGIIVRRRKAIFASGIILTASLIGVVAGFQWFHSPEVKRDQTLKALETGDAGLLVDLADPVEVTTLGLTPNNVRELLEHTLWRETFPKHVTLKRVTRVPTDQAIWETRFTGAHSGVLQLVVPIIDTPRIGWKLNLTMLLRSSCFWSAGRDEGPGMYRRLARQFGITGLREQDGGYVTIQVLEDRTAQIARLRGLK